MCYLTLTNKLKIFIPLFCICMLFAVEAPARTVTDQVGRTVMVPENPTRVIALAPSIAEIIYGLDQEKRLVEESLMYPDFKILWD